MSTPFENFQSWYSNIIRGLYPNRDAGFMIVMVAFPLLERYVRQKLGLSEQSDLNDKFYDELTRLLPELASRDQAKKLWSVYRNGLLHWVTLSRKTRGGVRLPIGLLSHDIPSALLIDNNGHLWLNPVNFSEQVLNIIEGDFKTFELGSTFPQVYLNIPVQVAGNTGTVTGTVQPSLGSLFLTSTDC